VHRTEPIHPLKNYHKILLIESNLFYRNKVFLLSLLSIILLASVFWTQSRIPDLHEKSQMGDRININAIAFDVVYPVHQSQPLYERTYKSSINWAYTNWKGMTFGFLLAATFLTLLQTLPKTHQIQNRYMRSLLGLSMGTPLGVCVNCATPIAQGLIRGGAKLETSLSLLLSSPTLNPIVIAIAFSLLPFHMIVIKIILSVVFILIIIPLLVNLNQNSIQNNTSDINKHNNNIFSLNKNSSNIGRQSSSWKSSIYYTGQSIFTHLIYIVKITLPLMILAGFLGALLIQSLPENSLYDLSMSPFTILCFAFIGVFLPVPIAFDILIINILINSGLDSGLAATLLFSLGIFSVYPALIIARTQSTALSFLIVISVVIFSIIAGFSTSIIDKHINQSAIISISEELNKQTPYITFDDVFDTCKSFNSNNLKLNCIKIFLYNNKINSSNINLCQLKKSGNINHTDNKMATSICQQIHVFLDIKKKSLSQHNIDICKSLNSDNLIDECKINYFRSNSLKLTTLDNCSDIKNVSLQRQCRGTIIAERIRLKSSTPCKLSLSSDMLRQCQDNVNANTISEFGEIEKCNNLLTRNAQKICRSTVSALRISDIQDYSVCNQLTMPEEKINCQDLVLIQKNLIEQNINTCNKLSNKNLIKSCKIESAIRKKLSQVQTRSLAYFNSSQNANYSNTPLKETKTSVSNTPSIAWSEIHNDGSISLSYVEHFKRGTHSGTIFKRIPMSQSGIDSSWRFNLTDYMEPFIYGKGITSGDFNNDGWPDLALATSHGVILYKNTGTGSFQHVADISLRDTPLNAFIVTLVDIDNDGWQDLFVSAYEHDNIIFKNTNGSFNNEIFYRLPKNDTIISLAAGFADWDKDGDIDIALGNWSYGAEGAFIPEKSQNVWIQNNALRFDSTYPDEATGESLSILLSDINNDNYIDMLVANDRKYPDIIYFGKSNGNFKQLTQDMKLLHETSLNTMSYDSADFNNDLLLDIFSTDMSVASSDTKHYCDAFMTLSDKTRCIWLLEGSKAVESIDIGWCATLKNNQRNECYTAMAIKLARRDKSNILCEKVSGLFPAKNELCNNITRRINPPHPYNENIQLKQKQSNKLLMQSPNKQFTDNTETMQVNNSYWSWTGKAADLDNDGWQDIYIGNGLGFGQHDKNIHSNVFYHNQQGKKFKQAEKEFGLLDYTNTPSYTYIDYDIDGDIDIISTGVMSSTKVFENTSTQGNSVSFILRDNMGNKFCVGCKIIISYGDSKNQIREIKLSGGFMSYDDTVVYFGLAEHTHINHIKIIWSTDEIWELDKILSANNRYKITRLTKQINSVL
jgi:uncharacterized membrane protein YraQ (UPF0718 family)